MGELEEKYFGGGEESSLSELPAEDASEADWQAWLDDYEPEPGQPEQPEGPPPDERLLSPEQWDFDYAQRTQAVAEVDAETNQAERLAYVEERAKEFNLTDPQVFARVDQALVEAVDYWYREFMASGYTEAQAREALGELDYDNGIATALAAERSRAFGERDPSLRSWRAGREADAKTNAMLGREPTRDVMSTPYIATLGRRIAESEQRQKQWEQGVQASYRRQTQGY